MKFKMMVTVTTYNFVEVESENVEGALAEVGELNFHNVKTILMNQDKEPLVINRAEDWNIEAQVMDEETGETIAETV